MKKDYTTRLDYMTRLERAARWRLPSQEAEDVVADYRELVGDPPRSEEELLRDLGRPRDAVKPLIQPKQYYVWLAVFLVMSACILTIVIGPAGPGFPIWRVYFKDFNIGPFMAAVLGAATALVWFRRQGRKEARLPRAIPILLAALTAWCGGVLLVCWMCARDFDGFAAIWGTYKPWVGPNNDMPISVSVYLLMDAMVHGNVVIALASVVWLVKARTGDRRWAAVYIMALAAILTSMLYVNQTMYMDIGRTVALDEYFRQLLSQCSVIAAIGLISTGVALC